MVPDENITLRLFLSLSSRFVQLDHLYVRLPNGQVVSMAEDRKYMLNAIDVDFNDQDTKYYADNITITGYIENVENPGPNEPNTRNVFSILDISSKLTSDATITISPNSLTHITTIKINNLRSRLTYNNGISLSSLEGVDEGITQIGINHNNTLSSDFNNIGVYNIYDRLSAGEGISITQGENGITNISSNLQPNWIVLTITSPVIAQHNHRYVTKKSGGNCSVTLPQNPSNGDRVSIFVDQVDIDREHGLTILLSIKNPYNTITLMEHVIPVDDNLDLDLLNYAELNFINGTWQVSLLTFESDTQYYDGDFILINLNNEINCTLTRLGQLLNDVGYITSDSFLQDAEYVKGTYNESTKEFSEDGENRYLKLTFAVSGNNGIVSKDEYLDVTELFEGYSEGFGIQLSNSQITLTGTVLTGDETHVFIRNNIISTNFKGSDYIDVSDDGTISFTGTDGSSVSSITYTNGFGLALSTIDEYNKQFYLTGTVLSGGTNIEILNNLINNLLSGGRFTTVDNTTHLINNNLSGNYPIYIDENTNLVEITPAGNDVIKVLKSVSGEVKWLDNTTNLSGGRYIDINEDNGIDFILSNGTWINFNDNKINCTLTGLDQLLNTPGYITDADLPCGTVYSTGFGLAASGLSNNIFYLTGTVLSGGTNIEIENNYINCLLSGGKYIDVNNETHSISTILHGDGTTITILDDGTISSIIPSGAPGKDGQDGRDGRDGDLLSGRININVTEDNYIDCLLSSGKFIDVDNNTHAINCLLSGDGTIIDIDENGLIYIKPGADNKVLKSNGTSVYWGDDDKGQDGSNYYSGRFNIVSSDNTINSTLSGDETTIHIFEDTGIISCLVSSTPPIEYTGTSPIVVNPETHVISFNGDLIDDDTKYYADGTTLTGYVKNNENYFKVWDIYSRLSAGSNIKLIQNNLNGITTISAAGDYLTSGDLFEGKNIAISTHYTKVNDVDIPNGLLIINLLSGGRFTEVDDITHAINSTLSGSGVIKIEDGYIQLIPANTDDYILKTTGGEVKWGPPPPAGGNNYYYTSTYLNGFGLGLSTDASDDNWFYLTGTILSSGRHININEGYGIDCLLSGDDKYIFINENNHIINTNLHGDNATIKILSDGTISSIIPSGAPGKDGQDGRDGTLLSGRVNIDVTEDGYIDCLLSGDNKFIFVNNDTHTISTNLHGDETTIHIDENTGTICSLVQAKNYNGDNTYIQVDGSTIKWIGGNLGNTYLKGPGIDIYTSDGKDYISTLISGGPNVTVWYENNYAVISSYVPSTNTYSEGFGIDIQQDPTTIEGLETLAHPNNYIISTTLVGDNKHIKVTEDAVISSLLKGDDSITEIDNNIIKIKPYTNDTVNYVLRSNKGVVLWGEDESGGGSNPPTPTPTISSYIYATTADGTDHSSLSNPYINLIEKDGAKTYKTNGIQLVGGTNVNVTSNGNGVVTISATDTNDHYITHLYAGTGDDENAVTTNGNTKLTVADNTNARDSVGIVGAGNIDVSSDANGTVTISGFSFPAPPAGGTGIVLLGYNYATSGYFWFPTAPCD